MVRFDDGDVLIDEVKGLAKKEGIKARKDLDPKTGLKLFRFV